MINVAYPTRTHDTEAFAHREEDALQARFELCPGRDGNDCACRTCREQRDHWRETKS